MSPKPFTIIILGQIYCQYITDGAYLSENAVCLDES